MLIRFFLKFIGCYALFAMMSSCYSQKWFIENDTILNPEEKNIVDESISQGDGQIRGGLYDFWSKLKGFIGIDEIKDGKTARAKLLAVIKGIINFILSLIGLIALIYLIYHGLVMLFSPGDDAKIEDGRKAIRYAAIAIIGIGVAWFIVSIIFNVLGLIIDKTQ